MTAIRNGDQDGNDATARDVGWKPRSIRRRIRNTRAPIAPPMGQPPLS